MTTGVDAYRQQLLLALRLRGVAGARIAEVLAEVDSHVAETGEDPREAFGAPKNYARTLVAELQPERAPGLRGWVASVRGAEVLIAALAFVGAWLAAEGLFALAAGRPGVLGLPGAVALTIAVALLAALALLLARTSRRRDDRILDPRTGRDIAASLAPRWAGPVSVVVPAALLVVAVAIGLLQR
jgi:hypothetical protein